MSFQPEQDLSALRDLVAKWAADWALPGFEEKLDIAFSTRFRTSVGRCTPRTREIRLASFLLTGPPAVLCEALCHEAAHAAAYELHGPRPKPHGVEWRSLMRAAGFEPRVRMPASLLPELPPAGLRPARRWEHRCPVCHVSRVARRRMGSWRCAACRAAGLEGALIVTEVPKPVRSRR